MNESWMTMLIFIACDDDSASKWLKCHQLEYWYFFSALEYYQNILSSTLKEKKKKKKESFFMNSNKLTCQSYIKWILLSFYVNLI